MTDIPYDESGKKQLFRELTAGMTAQWNIAHECANRQPSAEFPYEYKSIEINGHNIAYVDEGEGDPVLFIHGAPTSSYLWRNIMPWLQDKARVISIDLLGFGQSDKPDIEYGYFLHVEYVRKFIEQLGLENITLVLHDWGFNYGMEYAVDFEDNIKGICFAECLMWPRYPIVDQEAYMAQRPGTLRMYKIMQSKLGEEIVLDHNLRAHLPPHEPGGLPVLARAADGPDLSQSQPADATGRAHRRPAGGRLRLLRQVQRLVRQPEQEGSHPVFLRHAGGGHHRV
jgi:pimeloyl-ACP methyl ester carboxylesterase